MAKTPVKKAAKAVKATRPKRKSSYALKTEATKVSVKDFIANVENETRRKDAEALLTLFEKATGWKAKMWGPTIVGFGRYAYTYESGHTGEMCVVGFSPRKASLSIYSGCGGDVAKDLYAKLGKHKLGDGGCLYVNKLADIDAGVLEKVVKTGIANMKSKWPVSAG